MNGYSSLMGGSCSWPGQLVESESGLPRGSSEKLMLNPSRCSDQRSGIRNTPGGLLYGCCYILGRHQRRLQLAGDHVEWRTAPSAAMKPSSSMRTRAGFLGPAAASCIESLGYTGQ